MDKELKHDRLFNGDYILDPGELLDEKSFLMGRTVKIVGCSLVAGKDGWCIIVRDINNGQT